MSISNLLLGVWLILVSVTWLTWVVIDAKVLGLLGFITGLAVLFEGGYPAIFKRQ
jgi:hypothetical protein